MSSLRILKRIMAKVAELEGKPIVQPYEYFDLIAGTSTGGYVSSFSPFLPSGHLCIH